MAVTLCPGGAAWTILVKLIPPFELVVTVFWPMNFLPSPKPVGKFGVGLEKNWIRKVVSGALLSLASMVVESPEVVAESRRGKF